MYGGVEILVFEKFRYLVQPVFMKFIPTNLQTFKKKIWKQILNVTPVKLLFKNRNQCFLGFLDAFMFQTLIKGQHSAISWFLLVIARKWPLKLAIFQNSLRNLRYLQIGL